MPANVFERLRAIVAAGFAKLVEDVNRMAAAMYAPTAYGTADDRPVRRSPKTTRTRPRVATTSDAHNSPDDRERSASSTAGRPNVTLATTAPNAAPAS